MTIDKTNKKIARKTFRLQVESEKCVHQMVFRYDKIQLSVRIGVPLCYRKAHFLPSTF